VEPAIQLLSLTSMKALVLALLLAALGAGCSSDHRASPTSSTTRPTAVPSGPVVEGEAATWSVGSPADVSRTSTSFVAQVSRLGCNDGVTGRILPPTVRADASRIVVTFKVAPADAGPHTCPGNLPVAAVVQLRHAVGDRIIVDGACDPGADAATTADCVHPSSPVRWKP
jgi:hypothetical protein